MLRYDRSLLGKKVVALRTGLQGPRGKSSHLLCGSGPARSPARGFRRPLLQLIWLSGRWRQMAALISATMARGSRSPAALAASLLPARESRRTTTATDQTELGPATNRAATRRITPSRQPPQPEGTAIAGAVLKGNMRFAGTQGFY